MKVVIAHPTGNEFVRAAAKGLLNAGMLERFYTTVATFSGNIFDRMSELSYFSEFKRRAYDPALKPFTVASPVFELGRFAASKMGLNRLLERETGVFSIDSVYRNLDKLVAKDLHTCFTRGADTVYAYEDGALASFKQAQTLGMNCLYDLPIGYWRAARRLLDIERERWPDWAPTLTGFGDSDAKLAAKDEELRLASHIFVASSFTLNTLTDFPDKLAPIEVIPYAFPPVFGSREYLQTKGRPLKLLFVGGLSQRKGIANLFEAVSAFAGHVELTVVGTKVSDNCPVLDKELLKHTWIPTLPHAEILKTMRQHDVLVFPSLFEGFGLVITEAMSQGTPVITTERTAGPDLITDQENGWLVEAGSTEALQSAIEAILIKPVLVEQTGRLAMEVAKKRSWDLYGQQLSSAIFNLGNR